MSNAVAVLPLLIAPAQVIRGDNALEESTGKLADLGKRPLVVGGDRNLAFLSSPLKNLTPSYHSYAPDCSENSLAYLKASVKSHEADFIIGVDILGRLQPHLKDLLLFSVKGLFILDHS